MAFAQQHRAELTNDSSPRMTESFVTLVPAMAFAKSAAEFPTSSFIFVAACSRDWLAGLLVTKLATARACRMVELTGRCKAAGRGRDLQKARDVFLERAVRVNWRKTVFMMVKMKDETRRVSPSISSDVMHVITSSE